MLYADNALFYEIIRTAHDPDPVRSARLRPFGYPTARRPLDMAPASRRTDRRSVIASLVAKLVTPARVLAPGRRLVPAPCC